MVYPLLGERARVRGTAISNPLLDNLLTPESKKLEYDFPLLASLRPVVNFPWR